MGKTLYLDCTSGISGDMFAAALLDLGASEERLRMALASLPLAGYDLRVSRVSKAGLDCCDFDVVLDALHENHDHDMAYLHGHDHLHEHDGEDGHHHEHTHHHEVHHAEGHGHDAEHGHSHERDHDFEGTIAKTYAFAQELGVPVVSGSDTHQAFQYGCAVTVMGERVTAVAGLRAQVLSGNYRISYASDLAFKVKTAGMLKRALKEIDRLGGDYVQTLIAGAE